MEGMEQRLIPYHKREEMPDWVWSELKQIGINGGMVSPKYGGPASSILEFGACQYEMAKIDGSVAMAFLVQNCLGISVIESLADDEQKARWLPSLISAEKYISFGLTEPTGGSDASGLLTTATKVEGGYLLNGFKRWIGQGTYADIVVIWAQNLSDGKRV